MWLVYVLTPFELFLSLLFSNFKISLELFLSLLLSNFQGEGERELFKDRGGLFGLSSKNEGISLLKKTDEFPKCS